MASFDTTELLDEVRTRGGLSPADARLADARLLAAATREMREGICPLLWDAGAEWGVYEYSQAVVANTAAYRMPSRAAGGRLRKVVWVGSDGEPVPLTETSPELAGTYLNSATTGTPAKYYIQNYHVVLVPTPSVAGTLSTPFYARPGKLVLPSEVAFIAGALPLNARIQFNASPPSWISDGEPVDVVRGEPGFETMTKLDAQAIIGEFSPPLQWELFQNGDGAVTADMQYGYVCRPGESPIPQLPVELHGLLAVRTARRALKDVGELDSAAALNDDVTELEEKGRHWLSPRVDGEAKVVGDAFGGLLWGIGRTF